MFKPTKHDWFVTLGVLIGVLGLVWFVFSGDITLPNAFIIFGRKVYVYGLILAVSILAGYWLARKRSAVYGLTVDQVDSITLTLIVCGFIGARLYHVFTDFSFYRADPSLILFVWNGGLGIYGAIIGGLLGLWWFSKKYLTSVRFLKLLDFVAPSVLLGQIIGRFGNLFNYEIYGRPTTLPWKMFIPAQFRLPPFETFEYFHPLFLYESLAGLLLLYILVKWVNHKPGQIFWFWLGGYCLIRIFIELLRVQSSYILGLPQILVVTAPLLLVSLVMFLKTIYESKESQNI